MKTTLLAGAIAALALATAMPASATSYVAEWNFTGLNASAGGQLFVDSTADPNAFTLTNVTGSASLNGNGPVAITGTSLFAGADNVIYQNAPFVDFAGFSVATAGLGPLNFFFDGAGQFELAESEGSGGFPDGLHPGVLSVTHENGRFTGVTGGVPEPATWALMIIGFGGMGAKLRSTRRKMALAA